MHLVGTKLSNVGPLLAMRKDQPCCKACLLQHAQLNPACQLGTPLLLEARDCSIKLAHEGAVQDVTHSQLLQALAAGLR